ncbi:hypothetical protein GQ457_17G025760 [Hibiscus cannabinus]
MDRGSCKFLITFLLVVVSALHPYFCYAEKAPNYSFVKEATSAPQVSYHAYIVVGGGTAGCPLAATLSEKTNVLVLERGGSPYLKPGTTDKVNFILQLYDTSSDSYTQQFVSEDGIYSHRARVLGGGSVINAGFYSHADPEFIKEVGFDEALIKDSYQWVEKKVAFQSPVLQWQSAVRDGLLEAGVLPYNNFTYDHIKGTKIGATIFDTNDHRHTAADLLEYADPTNIKVYLHATFFFLHVHVEAGSRPKATGVIYEDASGVKHKAFLTKDSKSELIVSAGAVGSPQLLMLSGIGPANKLTALGIKVVMDQPMVGQNMADNALNAVFVPSPLPVEVSLLSTVGITESGNYIEAFSGLNLPPFGVHLTRFLPLGLHKQTRLQGGLIIQKTGRPRSTGYVELRSTNPNEAPKVTFNYFKDPEDLSKCVQGMQTILNVVNSNSFKRFRLPMISTQQQLLSMVATVPSNLRARHLDTTTSLGQFCNDTALTFWHFHGSCQIGKVVETDFRVRGVDSLRVIDASTFHVTPGTNPQATVMMLGSPRINEQIESQIRKENMDMGSCRFLKAFGIAVFALHCYLCHAEKAPCYSFVKKAIAAPRVSYHDYIVVGGGTAGCPLAATLSETANVLVLERGGSPYRKPGDTDKRNFFLTLLDSSPDSYAQTFVTEDGVYNQRARVLGGGTVINAGFYSHAEPEFVKASGLDEALVNDSYRWVEKKVVFEAPVSQWQSAVRDGLTEVGVLPFNGVTFDHINGTKTGSTIFDMDDHRHSAADLLEYADPNNIKVYLHATVHKIILTIKNVRSRPKAEGVIFEDASGVRHTALLNRSSKSEIIVSAGAIGSSQLLMLSGIGPADQLEELGIKLVMDQPMVGQGMGDSTFNGLFIPSPTPVELSLISAVGIYLPASYIEAASGFNMTPLSDSNTEFLLGILNQTNIGPRLNGGTIFQKVARPLSRGYIELRSTDPNETPRVRFNYFKEPEDLERCVQGMQTIINVINSKAFSKFRFPTISTQSLLNLMAASASNLRPRNPNTATSLKQFCNDTVTTLWHHHGGCRVGKVVDNKYRVLGVDGLRVIDASTFSFSPGTNPQATVMMLGR